MAGSSAASSAPLASRARSFDGSAADPTKPAMRRLPPPGHQAQPASCVDGRHRCRQRSHQVGLIELAAPLVRQTDRVLPTRLNRTFLGTDAF
jgi:hypothetical protein